jgi:hypothetical protein
MRAMDRRVAEVEGATKPVVSVEAILRSPSWWALRGALIRALRPYPAATAVVAALEELGAGEDPVADWRRAKRRR